MLDLSAGHSVFKSRSVLIFYFEFMFFKDKFYFKQDLDLEQAKVNSTTTIGMYRKHKDKFFHFHQFMVWSMAF